MAAARISVTAEVVGTGSDGTEPSIVFSVQRHGVYSRDVTLLKRYLFNCGEGTQRLCGENGVKLSSLDSMFFTRFDVNSVSGVPGMIFALSTCGAASLRLHGPAGLRGFLAAIQSFVRRRYPQIACVEVSDGESSDASDTSVDQAAGFACEAWRSTECQSDQHMRIFPVILKALKSSDLHQTSSERKCILCRHGDTLTHIVNAPGTKQNAPSQQQVSRGGREDADESDEHTQFRAWLLRFYQSKVPDKVPYVDVILNRYRGRYGDLKAQLCAKYGSIDEAAAAAAAESGSDSSSDSSDSDAENDVEPDFGALAFSREWLLKFYRCFQPEKLLHVDRVLKQFSGREDTLKQMLLQKYWTPNPVENGSAVDTKTQQHQESDEKSPAPQSKRRKLIESVPGAAAKAAEPEPQKVFVTPQPSDEAPSNASSLCYIMKFLHELQVIVWIIDIRATSHIDELAETFQSPAATGCDGHEPALVVHFSPPTVLTDPRYQTWMASLGAAPQQLVFDGRSLRSVENGVFSWVFHASARHTLSQQPEFGSADATAMWSSLSTFLADESHQSTDSSSAGAAASERHQRQIVWNLSGENGPEVHVAQSKQRFQLLRKDDSVTRQIVSDYERTGWRNQVKSGDDDEGTGGDDSPTLSEAESAQQTPVTLPDSPSGIDKSSAMKLIILGTGSAAPSKLRGSTGIYLELKPSTIPAAAPDASRPSIPDAMLIDCGEGTYGQLHRQFGSETAARIGGLRCVWISHSHADHQCGLVRVLYEFVRHHAIRKSHRRGLLVLAPQSVLSYASSWMSHIFDAEFNQPQHPFRSELFRQVGSVVTQLVSVPVWHCHDAFGLVLQLRNGQKIVYSGDTRPCHQLVSAGMHASLLIHEATFDDSMADDALKKKHSTVGEALEVARQMRAQEVVLTHFSQRYPKLPPAVTAASDHEQQRSGGEALPARVHCAFDGYVHFVPA